MKNTGVEFITLTPEQQKPFMVGALDIWKKWVDEAVEKGYEGSKLMQDFKDLLATYGNDLPEALQ
jgi:hypothetical protein